MKIKVTKDLCEIKENEIWNVGDYNVHTVQVELSPEFNGLVNKVRYFVEDNSYDMLITDNVAQVPYEATVMEGTIKIGVYGYDADTDILVQSTSPVNKYITSGTYTGDPDNTQPLTPTDKEQMETAIQKNTDDIADLKANKQDKLISGVNIKTINNESILSSGNLTLVTEETDPIFTNSPAYSITDNDITYWNNKANMSDIPDVSNFITKDVDDLTYYTKSTDMQTAINNAVGNERIARENADNSLQNQIDAITVSSDVVDVVSTYQDLVDYDTQHIKANDIIKVMQDSTHDNAISYYRWVIVNHVGSWEYVGSEGPYYTKSETDTLLNAKQNTLVSGQNIKTINNESLLGEGNINIQSGGTSDYTDLTNKPKINNVELKGNKTLNDLGIQPVGNYALESDMTEAQNDIDHLSKVSNLFEKITGTGTSVTLNDTSDTIMKLNLDTTTSSQNTTTGKNLLPNNANSTTSNGITFTVNNDGTITLDGTNNNVGSSTIFLTTEVDNFSLNAGTYYTIATGYAGVNIASYDGTNYKTFAGGSSNSFTLDSDTNFRSVYLQVGKGTATTFNNAKIYPIVSTTSVTINDYEPYTGGQPAPSPSYPQAIHVIKGNNEIKISNKNLWDYDNISNIINASISEKIITSNKIEITSYFNLSVFNSISFDSGTYVISADIKVVAGNPTLSKINDGVSNGTYILNPPLTNEYQRYATVKTYYSPFTMTRILFQFVGKDSILEIKNIMVEKSSTVHEYEPYKQQTYPINLGDIELCKIGDYQDVLFKNTMDSDYYDSSLELNKWYKLNNIGKKVLDGSETWVKVRDYVFTNKFDNCLYPTSPDVLMDCLCNNFTRVSNSASWNNYDSLISYYTQTGGRTTVFRYNQTKEISDFTTWLSTHNTIVYYQLATPTYTLLNDTLQTQLDNLQYAMAYDTQTNISQTNTDLPFIINAETYVDLTDYVKNTDYASSSTGGVIKTGNYFQVNANGQTYVDTINYNAYQNVSNATFISKGTLENVITGKELIDSSYHDSTKQNVTDESLNTVNKNIVPAINEVDSIAKGANQALSYGNYSTMITAFNSLANNVYNVGQNVMIITLQVPDLWISGIESTSSTYTYTTDEAITTALSTNGYIQVGYYKLSALETQKVDLTDYATKTYVNNLFNSIIDGDEVSY